MKIGQHIRISELRCHFSTIAYALHNCLKQGIDVGTGNSPYLEWFEWIDRRVSLDIANPYQSDAVTGVTGNVLDVELGQKFDLCTCLQVLEHVPDPGAFARRLFEIGKMWSFRCHFSGAR